MKSYIISPLIQILFVVALMYFLWGGVVYIWKSGSPEEREKGQKHLIYGAVGMAIMISVFGIVNFIFNSFRNLGPGIEGPIQKPSTLESLEKSGFQ